MYKFAAKPGRMKKIISKQPYLLPLQSPSLHGDYNQIKLYFLTAVETRLPCNMLLTLHTQGFIFSIKLAINLYSYNQ